VSALRTQWGISSCWRRSCIGVIFAVFALPLLRCAGADDGFEETDDEEIGSAEQALMDENGWDHNGWLSDNG
jgi:hypothetical protein